MHALSSSAIILDTVVKSTLLLAIAWGTALILKKRSAATQHMVRTFALAALLLLPISVMLAPAWHIKGFPQYPGSRTSAQRAITQQAVIQQIGTSQANTPRKAPTAIVKRSTASVTTEPEIARAKREGHSTVQLTVQPATVHADAAAPTSSPISAEVAPIRRTATTSLTSLIPSFLPRLLIGLWIA